MNTLPSYINATSTPASVQGSDSSMPGLVEIDSVPGSPVSENGWFEVIKEMLLSPEIDNKVLRAIGSNETPKAMVSAIYILRNQQEYIVRGLNSHDYALDRLAQATLNLVLDLLTLLVLDVTEDLLQKDLVIDVTLAFDVEQQDTLQRNARGFVANIADGLHLATITLGAQSNEESRNQIILDHFLLQTITLGMTLTSMPLVTSLESLMEIIERGQADRSQRFHPYGHAPPTGVVPIRPHSRAKKIVGPVLDMVATMPEVTEWFDLVDRLAAPGNWIQDLFPDWICFDKSPRASDQEAEGESHSDYLDCLLSECERDLVGIVVATDASVSSSSRHQSMAGFEAYAGGERVFGSRFASGRVQAPCAELVAIRFMVTRVISGAEPYKRIT
ncbi:hypothetical protein PQX77_020445, partial [Marasmius sp. AFHP31]